MTTIINTLPVTISYPGNYKLGVGGYFTSTPITITANDVQLDMDGQTIVCYTNANTQAKGVYIASNLTNVSVKNGTIRGFFYGVHFDDLTYSRSCTIENLTIQNSTFRGIVATGAMCVIRKNQIQSVSGTTVFPEAYAMGIECLGTAVIQDNIISEVYGTGTGEGVHISSSDYAKNTIISGNILSNVNMSDHTYLMWIGGVSVAHIFDNILIGGKHGVTANAPNVTGSVGKNKFYNVTLPYTLNSNVVPLNEQ